MTSYNTIWKTFLNNCKVSDIDLPKTDEMIYEAIKNGIMLLNNRLRTTYQCNDDAEIVNEKLSEDHLLILAFMIRLVFLTNQRSYFNSLWQPFAKDITIRNFSSQLKSIDDSIQDTRDDIERLIRNIEEDFL